MKSATALTVLLVASSTVTAAETVYVTDELRLGLYADETTTGRPLRSLVSGDELTVQERALTSLRVRTAQGDEGWVKSGYVVEEPPARFRIGPAEQRIAELTASLASLTQESERLDAQIEELQSQLQEAEAGIVRLPAAEAEATELRAQLAEYGQRVPVSWLLGAALGTFIIGCVAGYVWLDRRVRKRFAGLRI